MVRLAWMLIVMMGVACAGKSSVPPPPDGAVDVASGDAAGDGAPDVAPSPDAMVDAGVAPDTSTDAAEAGTPARLMIQPAMQAFAGVAGCKGTPFDFQVTNAGQGMSGPLTVTTGPDFPVTADSCQGKQLAGGGSCTLSVSFARAIAGAANATLSVTANPGGAVQVALVGNAIPNDSLTLTPNSVDLGAVAVGDTGSAVSLELKNVGGLELPMADATVSTGNYVVTSDGCGRHTLAPNETCKVGVAFRPKSFGASSAILTLASTSPCGGAVAQAMLSGTGVLTNGGLTIAPTEVDFGEFCTSKPAVFTVTNTGPMELWPLTVQLSGTSFNVVKNGCIAAVPPGQSCQIEVAPQSGSFGPVTGSLAVSAAGTQAVASLKGVDPGMADPSLSAPSIPTTLVGQRSAPVEVVVHNGVGAPTVKLFWVFTNVAASEYSVSDTDCDRPLPGGSSCKLHIVFAPTSTGVRNASLVVSAETCPGGLGAVQLSGIGAAP